MKYGDICNVMVFKNEEVFNKAVKILTDNGNGFELSGYYLALNFYPDRCQSYPYAQIDLALAGIKDGEHYSLKYR